ncbi:MAG: hypothetical protein AAGF77_12430 [Bacteroidota bacterium]
MTLHYATLTNFVQKFLKIGVFCSCFFTAWLLHATEYYVDPVNGNDGANGQSPQAAFRSLNKISWTYLQPGDTVFLMDGIHKNPGQTVLTIQRSGTEEQWITFRNYPGHAPIIEFDSWAGIDIINGASYLHFEGLKVKGASANITLEQALQQPGSCANDQEGNAVGLYNGVGILGVGPNLKWSNPNTTGDEVPHHITITNCEVYDCTSSGIAFQQADYITITESKVYNNCWYSIYGTSGINLYQFVNTDGTTDFHNTISNNLLYGNEMKVPQVPSCKYWDGNAFIIDDFNHTQLGNYKNSQNPYPAYSAKTLVVNNVSVQNGGSGLHFFKSDNFYVYNNTVVDNAFQNGGDNGNADLRVGVGANFEIKNNIFRASTRLHAFGGNNEDFLYTHNYQEGPGATLNVGVCDTCPTEGLVLLNTDITSDQPFITLPDSIQDKGTLIPNLMTDFLDNERPQGAAFDIGAYELASSVGCTPVTWYADFDGDGAGDPNNTISACVAPEDYVAIAGDLCPDDATKQGPVTWYLDADGDGVGVLEDTIEACEAPDGYVATAGDLCPDNATTTAPSTWYLDTDGDGVGVIEDTIEACEAPDGYVATAGDLCPDNATTTAPTTWYLDTDGDGVGVIEDAIEACEAPDGYVTAAGDQCPDDAAKTTTTTWYADTDGDGVGDSNDAIEACEAPEGYVATAGDQCPADENKTVPGTCGCGVVEGTCTPDPEDPCSEVPLYDVQAVYAQAGTQVLYNGKLYKNQWWSQGQLPENGLPWELTGICNGATDDCSTFENWTATAYPAKGTKIVYNGDIFQNRWYASANNIPGESNVWEFIGICTEGTLPAINDLGLAIAVYPVPTYDQLHVTSPEAGWAVLYDSMGKRIKSDNVVPAVDNIISLTEVPTGVYAFQVFNDKGELLNTVRIMKQ